MTILRGAFVRQRLAGYWRSTYAPTCAETGVASVRIALLSTLDRDPQGSGLRPAFAQFAGTMVVERALELALRLGCERVLCLVEAVEREVVELQHRAERAGAKFRAIRRPTELVGAVTADDELLVIASGVLPDDEAVEAALDRKAVLSFPADLAVPLGYERIDLELAWAGAMLAPGHLVERLGDLPEDVDVPSSLMRLALQSGTRIVPMERKLLAEGQWHLDADRKALELREKRWIDTQRRDIAFTAPGLAVAERAGARLARDIVGTPAEQLPTYAAIGAVTGSLGAATFGHPTIALGLATMAALFGHMGDVVERVSRLGKPRSKPGLIQRVLGHLIDPLFVVLLIVAAPEQFGILRAFVPIMLIGLLRLGEQYASEKWRHIYADRIFLGSMLSAAAFFSVSAQTAAVIALIALLSRFLGPIRGG